MLRGSLPLLYIYIIWILTAIHYLNYPDLLPYWPLNSVGRALVQIPPRSNFHWPVGTPKFPFKGVIPKGDFCVSAVFPISRVLRGSLTIYLYHLYINRDSLTHGDSQISFKFPICYSANQRVHNILASNIPCFLMLVVLCLYPSLTMLLNLSCKS